MSEMKSIDEAVKKLGVSKSTLATWRADKKNLAYYKVGGRVMYKDSDLDKFLEGKKIEVER